MCAAMVGNKPMVELLLKFGANPHFTLYNQGKTAADLARDSKFLDIAAYIEEWRMNGEYKNLSINLKF